MITELNLKFIAAIAATMLLSSCSTTGDQTSAANSDQISVAKSVETVSGEMSEADKMKKMADTLTSTNTTIRSEDGKLICKRTSVVGSNFKRKICATADEWEARAAEDRKTVGDLQRRGSGPGTNN